MSAISMTGAYSPEADFSSSPSSRSSKLHTAAQQFEALMIREMLKAARTDSSDDPLGDAEDTGAGSAMDMAQSQLASALAARGGLGLAHVIEKSMSRAVSGSQQATEIPGAVAVPSK